MSALQSNKPFTVRFIDAGPKALLELTNETGHTVRSVEILTVFLKDEETGGPSQAHIRFAAVSSMHPKEVAILSHRTWINGQPVEADKDELGRLKTLAGGMAPYVLDISWEDEKGKTQFQRIPVGH